jgi:hypothetical protein
MTDKKLSQLPAGTAVQPTDLFYSAQDIGAGLFTQVKQPASALSSFFGGARTVISSDTTYFVNALTGNDANSGLTPLTAFQTLAWAIHFVCDTIFIENCAITIQLANGTYPEFIFLRDYQGMSAKNFSDSNGFPAAIVITGDVNTPANVVIQPVGASLTNGTSVLFNASNTAWTVQGVTFDATNCDAAVICYSEGNGAYLRVNDFNIVLRAVPLVQRMFQCGESGYMHMSSYHANTTGKVLVTGHNAFGAMYDNAAAGCHFNEECQYDFSAVSPVTISAVMNLTNGSIVFNGSSPLVVAGILNGQQYLNNAHSAVATFGVLLPGTSAGSIGDDCQNNNQFGFFKVTGAPNTTITSPNFLMTDTFSVFKDTVGGGIGIFANDAGVIKNLGGGSPGGSNLQVQYNNSGAFGGYTNTQLTALINSFTSTLSGAVPASGGGTVNFMRADGTWAAPPAGGTPGGAFNSIEYNNAGAFGGLGPLTNGQLIIGSTGLAPVAATLTAGANITITNSAGGISIAAVGGSANMVIGTSTITGSTANDVLYGDGAILRQAANFQITTGNPDVRTGHAYQWDSVDILHGHPSGSQNTFIGGAGNFTNTGINNTGIAAQVLRSLTTGSANLAIGLDGLNAVTSGHDNIAIGDHVLFKLTTEASNIALGGAAGEFATGVSGCMFFGSNSGISATGGVASIGFGPGTLSNMAGGSNNLAMGTGAMGSGTCLGANNSALGASCLASLTTGVDNSAEGAQALQSLTTGSNNSGQGSRALASLTIGNSNFALGKSTLENLIDGDANVAIGAFALNSSQHDGRNIGIGLFALVNLNGGTNDIAIGPQAGQNVSSGSANIILGPNINARTQVTSGSSNVMLGVDQEIQSATASNQLNISNFIYGTGMSGRGSTTSVGSLGLGIQAPTAVLHLAASTTAQANLRFDPTSAAAPTTPNDGDMWYDGTNLKFRHGGVTTIIV